MGAIEYANSCAQCHGEDGNGDGYLAETLVVAPPDLTTIESRNEGTYPVSDIFNLILNGTWDGQVHATGQMPLWGMRYTIDAAESLGDFPSGFSIAVEGDVYARVAALVNHIRRLQRPGPESWDAAVAIISEQLPEILMMAPESLEFVAVVPRGVIADGAEMTLLWYEEGMPRQGSGVYQMQIIALRDLVGGQKQTSFALTAQDRIAVANIFGNTDLIESVSEQLQSDYDGEVVREGGLKLEFNSTMCLSDPDVKAPTGFPSLHVRDQETGKSYFEMVMPIDVMVFARKHCE